MTPPKITVVTVVFNGEKYVQQAIESVIHQGYKNLEYIIVDGGSTDGTLGIIDRYKNHIDVLISEPDRGIYDAMNKGLSRATGDVVGFLNGDDYYLEGALEAIAKSCEKFASDNKVIAGKWQLSFERSDLIITVSPSLRFYTGMPISHQALFVTKRIYDELGGYDLQYRYASDLDMLIRIYKSRARFVFLDDVIVRYRTSGASDRNFRKSVREASRVIRFHLPFRTYLAYRLISTRFLLFTFASRALQRTISMKAVGRLEKVYFKLKANISRHWV